MVFPDENEKYPSIEPPIQKDSYNMTKNEAEIYFNWWVKESPKRIELLTRMFVNTGGGNKEDLDYSPESLITLWRWYIPYIHTQKKSRKDTGIERADIPKHMKQDITISSKELHFASFRLLIDINFYFAEVFLRNNPSLKWSLLTKPKNSMDYNKPVIIGFKSSDILNPLRIVYTCTLHVLDGKKDSNRLYDAYNIWINFN
jgi:hypothetical protein